MASSLNCSLQDLSLPLSLPGLLKALDVRAVRGQGASRGGASRRDSDGVAQRVRTPVSRREAVRLPGRQPLSLQPGVQAVRRGAELPPHAAGVCGRGGLPGEPVQCR